jgi:mannose-6-phosphate isomerase-like protein (cupin superfamily)
VTCQPGEVSGRAAPHRLRAAYRCPFPDRHLSLGLNVNAGELPRPECERRRAATVERNVRFGWKADIAPPHLKRIEEPHETVCWRQVKGDFNMPATTVRAGERDPHNVLGMPLRFLCDARETNGAWSLFEEDIPFGMGPPLHRHPWDEAYYVLDGDVDFHIDGEQVRISPGDFTRIPANTIHGFKGASQDGARVLIFAAPGHSSEFFEDLNYEVKSLPEDLHKVPEIGKRHHIEMMPTSAAVG